MLYWLQIGSLSPPFSIARSSLPCWQSENCWRFRAYRTYIAIYRVESKVASILAADYELLVSFSYSNTLFCSTIVSDDSGKIRLRN